jgi:O-antigen/teichoic acid export membrane protein
MTVEQSVATEAPAQTSSRKYKKNIDVAAKGGGIIASGRLFAYGARFLLAYLLARALGVENYGLYTLAISAATLIAGITTFGLDSALVRYVAINARRKDEAGLWGALQIGLGLGVILSAIVATSLFALAYIVADRVFDEPTLAPLLQLVALMVPFMVMSSVISGATRGFKNMKYTVMANNFAMLIVRLILTIILFVIGMNAVQAVIVFGLGNLVATVMLIYFLHKQFSLKRPLKSATRSWREIFSYSVPLWISGLMSTFRNNIKTIFLGTFATVASVGIFSVISSVNRIGRLAFNSINMSTKPVIAELHEAGDLDQMGHIYHATTRWAVTINLPIFLILMMFPEEILSIFGREFADGATALRILAIAELANVGTGICGTIIDMTGYTKVKLFNSVVQVVTAIGINLLLIPRYGLIGAAIGSLAVIGLVNYMRVAQVWYIFRLLPYDRTFIKPILAAFGTLALLLLARQWLSVETNLIMLILQAGLVFVVFAGLLFLLRLPPEEQALFERLKRRLANYRPGAAR